MDLSIHGREFALPDENEQELHDNAARLKEQMGEAQAQAERERQEEFLRIKQMEAYERR